MWNICGFYNADYQQNDAFVGKSDLKRYLIMNCQKSTKDNSSNIDGMRVIIAVRMDGIILKSIFIGKFDGSMNAINK